MSHQHGAPAAPDRGLAANLSPLELLLAFTVAIVLAAGGLLWATAQLTALVWSGSWLDVSFGDIFPVLLDVAREPGDPTTAFGADAATQLPGPVAFWTVAVVLMGGALTLLAWLSSRRMSRRRGQAAGGARWATPKDLRTLIVRRPQPGRLTLGHGPGRRLLAAEPGHSLLVLGPTQSGKTSGLAIPAILEWEGPVVATSVKNDLVASTLDARRRRGTAWIYDPTGATGVPQAGWTPLANCHTWSGALRTASWLTQSARDGSIQEADFWYANAAKLLAPMLFAAARAGLGMSDVVRWVDLQDEDNVRYILEEANAPDALAAAEASWYREERARSSVYTTAETVLAAFADPAVAASARHCDIDPEKLLDGGAHTLYISAPVHEQARLRPLFTALVQQVIVAAYEQASLKGKLDPPLLLVLDEAANIAPLRDLDQIASTAAGLGIQLVTVWQDRAQIAARYGDRASTVMNNHRAKLVLSGITDAQTTADMAQLIGETEVIRRSTTVDADGRTAATHAAQAQLLASAANLRQLIPFEGVLVYGRLPPTRVRLRTKSRSSRGGAIPGTPHRPGQTIAG